MNKINLMIYLVQTGLGVLNSDDLILFNATVSQEYFNLYNVGLMTADELNIIRETGLNSKMNNI